MYVKRWQGIQLRFLLSLALCLAPVAYVAAEEAPITLSAPKALQNSGLLKHLLPRFRFKKRIRVNVVDDADNADMILANQPPGTAVFSQRSDGTVWYLRLPPEGSEHRKSAKMFLDWLRSKPGRAAIDSFPAGKPQEFDSAPEAVVVVQPRTLDGNAERGLVVARKACARCHVVEESNPFAGIGSTPSFAALRSFPDWRDTFEVFWTANPHRAVVTVKDMSEEKDPDNPVHIAPIVLSQDDVDDLVAYVASVKPKDLGKPIQMR